jgi:hypothetical protein
MPSICRASLSGCSQIKPAQFAGGSGSSLVHHPRLSLMTSTPDGLLLHQPLRRTLHQRPPGQGVEYERIGNLTRCVCVSHLITSKSSLMTIFILTIKTPRLLEIGDRIPGYNLSMISESFKCVLREWVEKSPCQISNFYLLSSKQGCQIVHQSRQMPPEEQRRRQVSSDWYLPCSSFEAAKGAYHIYTTSATMRRHPCDAGHAPLSLMAALAVSRIKRRAAVQQCTVPEPATAGR